MTIASELFVCAACYGPVVLQMINADDLAYCCQVCKHAVHVDCPEGLALAEDAALVLHAHELRANVLAADEAGRDPFDEVVELMHCDPVFDIGIAALLRTTIDIVQHSQRRTAVMSAMRVEAMAA